MRKFHKWTEEIKSAIEIGTSKNTSSPGLQKGTSYGKFHGGKDETAQRKLGI